MSRLTRCNRCGVEKETRGEDSEMLSPADRIGEAIRMSQKLVGWQVVRLEDWLRPGTTKEAKTLDLCGDCAEVFLEQFMVGAKVAPITKTADQTPLPHDPMTDCQLVFNPKSAGFVCHHDDPKLFRRLTTNVLQDVIEGVEATSIVELRGTLEWMDDMDKMDERDEEIDWAPDAKGGRGGYPCRHDSPERFDFLFQRQRESAMCQLNICGGCTHPVHIANDCPAEGEPGDEACECDEGLPSLGERVEQCARCWHAQHGLRRCLIEEEGQRCLCVGPLEDQLKNVPTLRSAPAMETTDE